MEAGLFALLIFLFVRVLFLFTDPRQIERREEKREKKMREKKRQAKYDKARQRSSSYTPRLKHFGRDGMCGANAGSVDIKENPYAFNSQEFSYNSNSMNPASSGGSGKLKRGGF